MTQRRTNLRDGSGGRAMHDVGGLDFGPIDRSEHEQSYYEKRVDALMMLMTGYQAFRVDAMRRTIEDYAAQEYDGIGYYDRWVVALRNLLVEQEVLTRDEIEARIADVHARLAADGLTADPEPVAWGPEA